LGATIRVHVGQERNLSSAVDELRFIELLELIMAQWMNNGAFSYRSRNLTLLLGNSCLSRKLSVSAFTNTQYSAFAIRLISTT
jgi:hypothetical protein